MRCGDGDRGGGDIVFTVFYGTVVCGSADRRKLAVVHDFSSLIVGSEFTGLDGDGAGRGGGIGLEGEECDGVALFVQVYYQDIFIMDIGGRHEPVILVEVVAGESLGGGKVYIPVGSGLTGNNFEVCGSSAGQRIAYDTEVERSPGTLLTDVAS